MYVCMYVCMYVYLSMYIYIYIYGLAGVHARRGQDDVAIDVGAVEVLLQVKQISCNSFYQELAKHRFAYYEKYANKQCGGRDRGRPSLDTAQWHECRFRPRSERAPHTRAYATPHCEPMHTPHVHPYLPRHSSTYRPLHHFSICVCVILAQGPCQSSLHRSNLNGWSPKGIRTPGLHNKIPVFSDSAPGKS